MAFLSKKKHNISKLLIFIAVFLIAYKSLAFFSENNPEIDFRHVKKSVFLSDNGLSFELTTSSNNVSDFLTEKNINLGDQDVISPTLAAKIYPGINITIKRAVRIKIQVDGKTRDGYTLSNNIRGALMENGVILSRLDKTNPDLSALPQDRQLIVVTRINEEEIIVNEDIDFKTTTKTDTKLGWREKKIEQKGEKGIKEVKYKVTYKNGQEVSRVALNKVVTKDPITQIEMQGTYVKLGKADKGQGTWYSYQGGLYAASLSIPRGGFAKVTNMANGKSVIVEINDAGPYGKGRIIDLDKVAFQKIASLGAGVISVKVEEVLN